MLFSPNLHKGADLRRRKKKRINKQQQQQQTMVNVKEEVHTTSARVFKWNEKLSAVDEYMLSSSAALIVLLVNNTFTFKLPNRDDDITLTTNVDVVRLCDLEHLLSTSRLQNLIKEIVTEDETLHFPDQQESIAEDFASEAASWLSTKFHFCNETLRYSASRIVIAVEGRRKRTVEITQQDVDCGYFTPGDNTYLDTTKKRKRTSSFYLPSCNYRYGGDVRRILCALREYLTGRVIYPTVKVVEEEPSGLLEVETVPTWKKIYRVSKAMSRVSCPICLVNFTRRSKLAKTSCSHVFHSACLSRCLSRKPSCPLCRNLLYEIKFIQFATSNFACCPGSEPS